MGVFDDKAPAVCAVCRREATGYGYSERNARRIAWACDEPSCRKSLREVYTMPEPQLSRTEALALDEAGQDAGAYLESIGKTDLGELTKIEWSLFLKRVLLGYERGMRARLAA